MVLIMKKILCRNRDPEGTRGTDDSLREVTTAARVHSVPPKTQKFCLTPRLVGQLQVLKLQVLGR